MFRKIKLNLCLMSQVNHVKELFLESNVINGSSGPLKVNVQ